MTREIGSPEPHIANSQVYNSDIGTKPRDMPDGDTIGLILPDEPPPLPPAAARALLRILLTARARRGQQEQEAQP